MNEIRSLSEKGLDFIISRENLKLKPYLDSGRVWTIGIGFTYYPSGTRVKGTDKPISFEECIQMFHHIVVPYERTVWSNTRDDLKQNEFDALVSLTWNIGPSNFKKSTVLHLVNHKCTDNRLTYAFEMWNKDQDADGNLVVVPGLTNRRRMEAKLYIYNIYV